MSVQMDVVLLTGEVLSFEVEIAATAEVPKFSLFRDPGDDQVEALFVPYGTRT